MPTETSTTQTNETTETTESGDAIAVGELLSDIEAEMRLHQARIQEFLDGTREFEAVTGSNPRARLLRANQAIGELLDQLADISE